MSLLQIVCDNCGAKYRLPETFTGASAKCKQCGSSINVAAQRAAAAAPAAAPAAKPARTVASSARPAAAKPASARPASSAGSRPSARKPRAEADAAPAKNNKPLIFGGIGAAAAIVVVAVLMMGGDKKDPKKDKVAAKPAAEAAAKPMDAAAKPAEKPVAAEAKAPKKQPVDEGPASPAPAPEPAKAALVPAAKPAAAPAKPAAPAAPTPAAEPQGQGQGQGKPAAKPTETPAAKPAAGAGGKTTKDALQEEREKLVLKDLDAWQKQNVKSLDQVPDVTKTTKALVYPAEITAEDQKKMADLLAEAKDGGGGARTGRALRKIEAMGFSGLYFLINTLREINYKDYDSLVWANQLNMSLTSITLGVNVGFVPVEAGPKVGELDPRIAKWNADSVQQWLNGAQSQWPSKAKFDEYIAKRKAKKDAEVEEGDKEGAGK